MSDAVVELKLPAALVTRADLARLIREVEAVDTNLESQKVKAKDRDHVDYHLPTMSSGLHDFLELNKVTITKDRERMAIKERLTKLKDSAPVVHMTFAVAADTEVLQKLVDWLRTNAHPQSLISVGLQPGLVGGVYVRTPNHVHDFSMRSMLEAKRDVMRSVLEEQRS